MGTWRQDLDPVALVALEEIEGGAPISDAWELEALATAARTRCPSPDADTIAAACGCRVVREAALPPGADGMLLPSGTILVRARRDARRTDVAILHELAHWLLERAGALHSHADVWCLTLALAVPLGHDHPVVSVSPWALAARSEMPTVLIRAGG